MPDTQPPLFDVAGFIAAEFQSVHGVAPACEAAGFPIPNIGQIRKWVARQSVPGEWLAILLAVKEAETLRPLSITQFVQRKAVRA